MSPNNSVKRYRSEQGSYRLHQKFGNISEKRNDTYNLGYIKTFITWAARAPKAVSKSWWLTLWNLTRQNWYTSKASSSHLFFFTASDRWKISLKVNRLQQVCGCGWMSVYGLITLENRGREADRGQGEEIVHKCECESEGQRWATVRSVCLCLIKQHSELNHIFLYQK